MAELGLAIIGAVDTGLKLSFGLYQLATDLADAGVEIQALGADVSMTCNALNQVHTVLARARGCRASTAAIDAAQETVARCKTIFNQMETVYKSLQKNAQSRTGTTARIKWVLKKPRLRLMQQSLQSCIAMLHLMIASLSLSYDIANGSLASNSAEETRRQSINAGLLLAQQAANQQLEAIEEECQQSTGNEDDDVLGPPAHDIAQHRRTRSANEGSRVANSRHSRIVDGEILREPPQAGRLVRNDRPTSMVLNKLLHSYDGRLSLYSSRWSRFSVSTYDDTLELSRELQQRWTAEPRDDSDADAAYSADLNEVSLGGNQVRIPVPDPSVRSQRPPPSVSSVADRDVPTLPPEITPSAELFTAALFTVASVYEFNTDSVLKEAGIPYLTYVAGEIFDVIGEKGELWLARNQDARSRQVGWIWSKHFAKLDLQAESSAFDEDARSPTNQHATTPSEETALLASQEVSTLDNAAEPTSKPAQAAEHGIIATAIIINNIPAPFKKTTLARHMTDLDLPFPRTLNFQSADGVFAARAIATFDSPQEATQVINSLNSAQLGGNKLHVEHMKTPLSTLDSSAVSTNPPIPHIPISSSDPPKVEIFKSFKVALEDPCWKVLPAALKKYNIQADWRHYSLIIVYGDLERSVGLEEKPLILFKELDRQGKKPIFMLRKLASPTITELGPRSSDEGAGTALREGDGNENSVGVRVTDLTKDPLLGTMI